jgi:phosphatidate cytidylyltransferase
MARHADSPLACGGGTPQDARPSFMSAAQQTFFRRLSSTLVLWTLIVGSVVAGSDVGFFLLILFMGMVGLYEYFHMVKEQGARVFPLTGMICGAVYLIASFLYLRSYGSEGSLDLEMGVLVAFLFAIFVRQMFRGAALREPLEAIAYTVFGLLYIPWLFNFITKIIYLAPRMDDGATTGQYYVIFLILVTKFSDMGAYVFGSLFGRHPMVPHISPKKTWEGFAGALISSMLGALWLYYFLGDRLSAFRFGDVWFLALLLGGVAVVGDLAESIIKRSAHAKDSSHILPGIGGTLDLIDSLLFTAPVLYFYLTLVVGLA